MAKTTEKAIAQRSKALGAAGYVTPGGGEIKMFQKAAPAKRGTSVSKQVDRLIKQAGKARGLKY